MLVTGAGWGLATRTLAPTLIGDMAWTSLCQLDELTEGEGKYVEIGGFQLAVWLDQGQVYVTDNECPHASGNLSSGFIENGHAVCPWHFWAFKLQNGQLKDSPYCRITTYPVRMLDRPEQPRLVQADLPMF
jgi:nitrite reductase (NADH) small subunit